jgi:hypothetical protein
MKKSLLIGLSLVASLGVASVGCKKRNMNVCISTDKASAQVDETITVSNCGDELPSMASPSIDWGDGSVRTDGITGTHSYSDEGTYTIKLYVNDEPASDKVDDASKVEVSVTIN